MGAFLRHRLGQDAAAAANVEQLLGVESLRLAFYVGNAYRVDIMKRLEFAFTIPPAACDRLKLVNLGGIYIGFG